jgi:hypothetical protein
MAAALLLALVVLAVNARLLAGAVGPKWDADDFFGPYFTLVADHARAGRLLLWDPWTSGGAPDGADPQLGAFSPLTVLAGALAGGSEVGFRAYWLGLWLLGPLGLLVLGRHLGAPPWGGFAVAVGFALSGFYTGHAEHTSLLYPVALLPFVLWRLDVALGTRRLRPALEAGALWGLAGLAAYPLMAVLSAGFAGMWGLGRWAWPEAAAGSPESPGAPSAPGAARPGDLRLAARAAVGALAVGALVLSPAYVLLFTETVGYTDRAAALPRAVAVESNALHPGALATVASPYLALLKLPRTNPTLWPGTDVSTASLYLGAAVTVLAVFALTGRGASAWRWWLAGTGLFFLACALGPHLPLRGWLYDWLPPTRYFRHPGFFRVYAMAAAAVLALLATRDLEAARRLPGPGPWRRLAGTALVVALAALATAAAMLLGLPNRGEHPVRAALHLGLVWPGVAAIAVAARVAAAGRRRRLPVALGTLAVLDAVLTMTLVWPLVHEPGPPRRVWDRIDAARTSSLELTANGLARELRPPRWVGGHPTNKNLPLKVPTLVNFVAMANRFHAGQAAHPLLAPAAVGGDRLWFAREVVTAPPADDAFRAFVARSEAVGAPVVVAHLRGEMGRIGEPGSPPAGPAAAAAIGRLAGAERLAATVLRYTPTELRLRVAPPGPGWLLVTDRWAPGWRATVNAVPTEVLGGNFVFRLLPVGPGPTEVGFTYRPAGWPWLVAVSWGTLAAVLTAAVRGLVRRDR